MTYNELIIYLAGFFDAEGNIDIYRCKPTLSNPSGQYRLQTKVVQVNKDILGNYVKCFGGKVVPQGKQTREKWHQYWQWIISSNKAKAFLQAILPYLQLKEAEAKIAIEFQKSIRPGGSGRGVKLTGVEIKAREAIYRRFRLISPKRKGYHAKAEKKDPNTRCL